MIEVIYFIEVITKVNIIKQEEVIIKNFLGCMGKRKGGCGKKSNILKKNILSYQKK